MQNIVHRRGILWWVRTHQVSSHSQSIAEHFEQKCRSDDTSFSSGVPRFKTALYVLSSHGQRTQSHTCGQSRNNRMESYSYEMSSFPLVIWSVCACAPRLIDPPVPPTLRQMEHMQS